MRSCLRKQRNKWGGAWVTFIEYQVHASECDKDSFLFLFLRQGLYTALANLELTNHRDPLTSTSWVIELKAYAVTTPGCAKNHPCVFALSLCKLGWPWIPDLSACVYWGCRLALSHLPGFLFKSSPKIKFVNVPIFQWGNWILFTYSVCVHASERACVPASVQMEIKEQHPFLASETSSMQVVHINAHIHISKSKPLKDSQVDTCFLTSVL